MTHRRSVFFIRNRSWLIVDRLTPRDGAEHAYELYFHLDATQAEPAAGRVTSHHGGDVESVLIPKATVPLSLGIVKGRPENPQVPVWTDDTTTSANLMQGWAEIDGVWQQIPTVVARFETRGPAVLATAFAPFQANVPPGLDVSALTVDGAGRLVVTIGSSSGTSERFEETVDSSGHGTVTLSGRGEPEVVAFRGAAIP